VAIPNFPLEDSFIDNVAHTLCGMGHEVLTPSRVLDSARSAPLRFAKEMRARALPLRWSEAERWVVEQAKHNRLDLVICLTQSLKQEVLEALRKAGVQHLVAWWGDTPANMRGLGLLAPGWDGIFLKDAAAVRKLRAVGLPAEHLNEAMNPDWHRRNFSEIGEEVAVAGSYYGYRQYIVGQLLAGGAPMALYGPRPPRWADAAIARAHRGRYITKHEKSAVFGSALACLNSTAISEGDALNCRAFEIAGACGLQLIEDKRSVEDCFEPGVEVLTFASVDEIHQHLDRALKDRDWAMKVREAGHRRAHAEHTYAHRISDIFRHLEIAA